MISSELSAFKRNVTSQNGEDGIIEEIFRRIKPNHRIAVEFGAWDGIYLSNTYNLWANEHWKAYLIEADKEKFEILKQNTFNFPHVTPINAWVGLSEEDKLDTLLSKYDIPADFDLLSIDVDGNDYYIFQSLENYSPTLIIVEFNFTIPLPLELIQKPGEYFGASAMAMYNLAKLKGYELCCISGGNLFFVRSDRFKELGIPSVDLSKVFPYEFLCHVISAYDGRLFLTKKPIFKNQLSHKTQFLYREKILFRLGRFSIFLRYKRKAKENPAGNHVNLIPVEIIT
ncbi:MAG: FkbM family methyltransferase [Bacteroidales bacterium]